MIVIFARVNIDGDVLINWCLGHIYYSFYRRGINVSYKQSLDLFEKQVERRILYDLSESDVV